MSNTPALPSYIYTVAMQSVSKACQDFGHGYGLSNNRTDILTSMIQNSLLVNYSIHPMLSELDTRQRLITMLSNSLKPFIKPVHSFALHKPYYLTMPFTDDLMRTNVDLSMAIDGAIQSIAAPPKSCSHEAAEGIKAETCGTPITCKT